MYDEICRIIKDLPNPKPDKTPLSKPALALLEEHKEKFKTSSAAVYMHHNYKCGLIYHTYRMVKAAAAMCEIYKELDKEILVCATALHDLGKIHEYNTDPVGNAETTELAALYGHLYLGAMFFSNKCAQITGCDKERQRLLTHCILAHHGQGEWGAVRTPATPEAFALHYIDNLDAKIESCNIMYDQTQPGKSTEKKLAGFDRLYKPTYFDND
jgi:3'-5' exoribonuclease